MRDLTTDAWVLEKIPVGDYDARLVLFARELGRVMAKATSVRKITSKLAAHVEPFSLARVRLAEGRGNGNGTRFQVTDALRYTEKPHLHPSSAKLLRELTPEGEPDPALWHALSGKGDVPSVLRALGFDPVHASCAHCGGVPSHFSIREYAYYCGDCAQGGERELFVALS